jgi:sulfur carrier protein
LIKGLQARRRARPAASMDIQLNGRPQSLAPGATVADLITLLGYAGKRIAVERNAEIVPRSRHGETVLEAGDKVEIVVAVGGG